MTTSTHYLRFVEDNQGLRYVNINDLLNVLRHKMTGSAAGIFVNELSAEIHEAAEKALSNADS